MEEEEGRGGKEAKEDEKLDEAENKEKEDLKL